MPGYCAPWPGNMKTTGGAVAAAAVAPTASRRAARAISAVAIVGRDDQRAAVAERAAADVQREGDVGQVELGMASRGASASRVVAVVERLVGCAPTG